MVTGTACTSSIQKEFPIMSIRTSLFSALVLGSVAATSFAGENMIGQGADRRDASEGLSMVSSTRAEPVRQADASNTQAMGASRSESTMQGARGMRQSSDMADPSLHRGGN
jgi:hypothetical protein